MATGIEKPPSLDAYMDLCNNILKYIERQETFGTSGNNDKCQCERNSSISTTEKITWMHDFLQNSSEGIFKHEKLQETLQSQLDKKTAECEQLKTTIARLNSDLMKKTAIFEQLKTFVECLNLDLKKNYGQSKKLSQILGVVSTAFTEDSCVLVNTQSDIDASAKENNSNAQQTSSASIQLQSGHAESSEMKTSLKNASSLDESISPQRSEEHGKNVNKTKNGSASPVNTNECTIENQHNSIAMKRNEDIEFECLDAVAVAYRAKVIVSNASNTEFNRSDAAKLMRKVYLAIVGGVFEEETPEPVTLPEYVTKFIEVFLPKTIGKILPICGTHCTEGEKYDIATQACQLATAQAYLAKQKFSLANNLEFNLDDTVNFTRKLFDILMYELVNASTTESAIVTELIPKSSPGSPTTHAEESLVSASTTATPVSKNVKKSTSSSYDLSGVSTRRSKRRKLYNSNDWTLAL